MSKQITQQEFIEQANIIHGYKYKYDNVNYINRQTAIDIICPKHGLFSQKPGYHLVGAGCSKCGHEKTIAHKTSKLSDFIARSISVHGGKYCYDKVLYVNTTTRVEIICPTHGVFWQLPHNHTGGRGCKQCSMDALFVKNTKTKEEFITDAIAIHGNTYSYDRVDYFHDDIKIEIVCNKHGSFWQTPNNHLHGKGCPTCNNSSLENSTMMALQNLKIEFEQQKTFGDLRYVKKLKFDFYIPKHNTAIECHGL